MFDRIKQNGRWLGLGAAVLAGATTLHSRAGDDGKAVAATTASAATSVKSSLSVQLIKPQVGQWALTVPAHGAIAPWQEAVIGAELAGLRLSAVLVNVGDQVRRGQVLATMQADSVQADVNTARAALAEAEALLREAKANADRAHILQDGGAVSTQNAQRSVTAGQTSQAHVDSARAQLATQELRLRQTRIVASDDGVISARIATVGSVVQPGQELFRLIRQSRLEWRAELPSAELRRIKPGMVAWATPPGGEPVQGRVRVVAPTVDAATRNGLVYVDLPASAMSAGARAGMYASGHVDLGATPVLTVPQSAVLLREGFSYVFKVSAQGVVSQTKVAIGRRSADRIEVLQGLDAKTEVVASGVGFLGDGDTVRVVKGQP